jgi:hypothetical protein
MARATSSPTEDQLLETPFLKASTTTVAKTMVAWPRRTAAANFLVKVLRPYLQPWCEDATSTLVQWDTAAAVYTGPKAGAQYPP